MAKKHKVIDKTHPEFGLTYAMMLGVRTTVSKIESKPPRELVLDDFRDETKLRFESGGTPETPAHNLRSFKFKDYAPEVFRHIRARCGVTPSEYLLNVCGNFDLLEFVSNSKSGSFFFYSHDGHYMVKTLPKVEARKLLTILPAYYHHVMRYENTLLTRFFGLHRVKPHKRPKVHFLIFGSVFFRSRFIHKTFDLKGSSHGRSATEEEKQSDLCVQKDNDFRDQKVRIRIGAGRARVLKDQLERDVEFLHALSLMDYSLLLGIHDSTMPVPAGEHAEPSGAAASAPPALRSAGSGSDLRASPRRRRTGGPEFLRAKSLPQRSEVADEKSAVDPADVEAAARAGDGGGDGGDAEDADDFDDGDGNGGGGSPRHRVARSLSLSSGHDRRQSLYGLPSYYDRISHPEEGIFAPLDLGALPEHVDGAMPADAAKAGHPSLFTADDGGIRGLNDDGTPNGEVYYLGLIDILTVYDAKKKAEHFGKGLRYDKDAISCVPPKAYARRFKEFMYEAIE